MTVETMARIDRNRNVHENGTQRSVSFVASAVACILGKKSGNVEMQEGAVTIVGITVTRREPDV